MVTELIVHRKDVPTGRDVHAKFYIAGWRVDLYERFDKFTGRYYYISVIKARAVYMEDV